MGCSIFYGCENLRTVYCYASSQPKGWQDDWLGKDGVNVVWGYVPE